MPPRKEPPTPHSFRKTKDDGKVTGAEGENVGAEIHTRHHNHPNNCQGMVAGQETETLIKGIPAAPRPHQVFIKGG